MNRKWLAIFALSFIFSLPAYADETARGAAEFDWNNCVGSNTSECLNNCTTSSDINCGDNCKDLAKDKCKSMGLNPPN